MLKPMERRMLSAALDIQVKTAAQIMTPIEKCFMIEINSTID
jgi:CBS domain containing-hemolysin-like protein